MAGKYRVESVLGEGAMGVVFAATHVLTGRSMALKWMQSQLSDDPRSLQRFLREARVAGGIDHPNVIAVYDVGFEDRNAFMVMERLHGEPLSALLTRAGPLPLGDALAILMPALAGVSAAHACRVVHRDVKPENIFLCRTQAGASHTIKVLDFGISKPLIEDPFPGLTQSGTLLGTPYYMSPEQVRGRKDVDTRVDVYAFGVILYEALTGELPFRGQTFGALAIDITLGTPRPPRSLRPDLPPAIERVILQAMAREPSERFADASSLRAALLAATQQRKNDGSGGISPPGATIEDRGTRRRHRGRLAAWAALTAASVVAAAWVTDCSLAQERGRPGLVAAPPAAAAAAPALPAPREIETPPETPRPDDRPVAAESRGRAGVARIRRTARVTAPSTPVAAPTSPEQPVRSRSRAKVTVEDF